MKIVIDKITQEEITLTEKEEKIYKAGQADGWNGGFSYTIRWTIAIAFIIFLAAVL